MLLLFAITIVLYLKCTIVPKQQKHISLYYICTELSLMRKCGTHCTHNLHIYDFCSVEILCLQCSKSNAKGTGYDGCYSPNIPSRLSRLYINYHQVLELILLQSHLPGLECRTQYVSESPYHIIMVNWMLYLGLTTRSSV